MRLRRAFVQIADSARADLVFRQPSRAAQINWFGFATCFGCARGIMAVVEQPG
jgi:hypothetical protein